VHRPAFCFLSQWGFFENRIIFVFVTVKFELFRSITVLTVSSRLKEYFTKLTSFHFIAHHRLTVLKKWRKSIFDRGHDFCDFVSFLQTFTLDILISKLTLEGPREQKFSQPLQAEKTVTFDFSHHDHALVILYVQFVCSDWSKFDRWVHAENLFSILKFVYFDSWSWQFCVSQWCFKKWNTAAMKSLLLFMAGVFIGFLVQKCAACQSRKSDSGWHRFHFSPCLMQKRVEKSQVTLALLDGSQELHLEWQAWVIIAFDNLIISWNWAWWA